MTFQNLKHIKMLTLLTVCFYFSISVSRRAINFKFCHPKMCWPITEKFLSDAHVWSLWKFIPATAASAHFKRLQSLLFSFFAIFLYFFFLLFFFFFASAFLFSLLLTLLPCPYSILFSLAQKCKTILLRPVQVVLTQSNTELANRAKEKSDGRQITRGNVAK